VPTLGTSIVAGEGFATAPSPALAPPPGNPRFPLFDGLRGMAVLGILAFHDAELTGRVGFGAAGRAAEVLGSVVPTLFFVISGFLLYRPFVAARVQGEPTPSVGRYARRRALRILPGYWIALTLLAIYPGINGVFSSDWWRYYGYLQLYSTRTLGGGIAVAWTLCVEVTFYIALPVWAVAIRRVGPLPTRTRTLLWAELVPLALVAAGGVAVQLASARRLVSYPVGISIAGQCTWLWLGMALAVASVACQRDRGALSSVRALGNHAAVCWGLSAAAFAGLIALVPAGGVFGLIGEVATRQALGTAAARIALYAVVVFGLVLPAIFGERRRDPVRRALAARPLVWLGVISYSFYLFHLTVSQLIAGGHQPGSFSARGLDLLPHLHAVPTLVLYVVTLVATGAVAAVSYRLVELPFLRRKEPDRWAAATSILPGR
jgi:peptidoglycan/LPS O-acetylase OafA/YrhL